MSEDTAPAGSEFRDVTGVRVVSGYVLELTFDNDEVRVLDVEEFLWGPAFEPLRNDYEVFCAVRVDPEMGTIVWPKEADLAPELLYARSKPQHAPGE